MIRRVVVSLRALALGSVIAVAALFFGARPGVAEPGLWVAKGPSATVYLFGTIHLLRKGEAWEPPAVAAALAASQELWLEVPDPGDAQAAQTLMQQLGFDRTHPLSSKLPPGDLAHLDGAAKSLGIAEGEKAFEPMRPWLVSIALEDALVVHAGYDPQSGVETVLRRDAVAAGKSVRGFETLEQQLHFFADMNPALELQLLQNTLQDFDEGPQKLTSLVTAWRNGDDTAIARTMVDEIKGPFPALYRTILVGRNEAWADAIAAMLKGSGVRFVAVGAAHLAGPDSVQAALERRSVHVERIATKR
jgi:uncharacterized protein YbaP (TraB family)